MTAAEKAYAEAVRLCLEAERTGATALSFGFDVSVHLERLPPELGRLTGLRSLSIVGRHQIADLKPLASLTSLQSLMLSWCEQVSDLGPLEKLTGLQSLDLSRCRQVADLEPLANLAALRSLSLGECHRVADLKPLANLTGLRRLHLAWCEEVADLKPLANLNALQSLILWGCEQVADLMPLGDLTALQRLGLLECEKIADLTPLAGLTSLRELDLSACGALLEFAPLERIVAGLEHLYLYGTRFTDLPSSICGEHQNVAENVRAHYRDLRAEASQDSEVKVLVLGNGTAGKTQLCRRLRGLEYNPSIPSTHGIELGGMELDMEGVGPAVRLNLWDFGGQDIYHGAHTLFLQGHSVCLILWTPALEKAAPYEENGVPIRHRPLAYWMDYVRAFAGAEIPVVVVQSQCDSPVDRVRRLPAGVADDCFASQQNTQASAKTGLGLDTVKAALKEATRDLLARRPLPPIGGVRVRVRDKLREILEQDRTRPANDRRRWLERGEFDRMCGEAGRISNTEALLEFLHYGGSVFYRKGLFGGRIVVDQNWALEAIYSVCDRKRCGPIRRNGGRFSRSDLESLVWQQFSVEEQRVFLGMMESCGICFRVSEGEDAEYIAPDLLPGWTEAQERLLCGRLLQVDADAEAEARFEFLHEGTLRLYVAAVGRRAGDAAIYWRYGCWVYEKTTDSRVLVESRWRDGAAEAGPGSIRLRAWGRGAQVLLTRMVEAIDWVVVGQRPTVEWKLRFSDTLVLSDSAAPGDLSGLDMTQAIGPPLARPAVYVSYAWEDAEVVDGLCRACTEEGWEVFRDTEVVKYGQQISDFMKAISKGDLILAVIGEKYLRSRNCTAELHGIYQRSGEDREEFLTHVIPLLLGGVRIGADARGAHAEYWRKQAEKMQKLAGSECFGVEDSRLLKQMQKWALDLSDMLAALDDKFSPRGLDAIVADDYRGLREMLRRRRRAD